jgi:rfaE bifunctional protein nucleotidyltransferase chain/domain
LQKAKELGDYLVIGLNSDSSVKKLKGENRPINSEDDRAIVLNELKSIDFVIIFEEETPYNLISTIIPDVLVKGGDYNLDSVVGRDIVESYGGQVKILNFVEGKSSTNIIEKMKV